MPALSCIELNEQERAQLRDLVWQVLKTAVTQKEFVLPPQPESKTLLQLAATFVTIYVNGELRGCTGICEADTALWKDVCKHAYSSSVQDRRFETLREDELEQVSFHISILSPMTPIPNHGEQALLDQLKPGVDGLLIEQQYRHAVFLPSVWRSLDTPEQFLAHLKHKGGWSADYWSEQIQLYLFYTVEYAFD